MNGVELAQLPAEIRLGRLMIGSRTSRRRRRSIDVSIQAH